MRCIAVTDCSLLCDAGPPFHDDARALRRRRVSISVRLCILCIIFCVCDAQFFYPYPFLLHFFRGVHDLVKLIVTHKYHYFLATSMEKVS